MSFATNPSWSEILQNDVLGPFAPRSGFLAHKFKKENYILKPSSIIEINKRKPTPMLNKDFSKASAARSLMKKIMKYHNDEDEEKKDYVLVKKEIPKRDLIYGQICDVFCGTKVN